MLKVHHLVRSQSQRIVWLCEELEISYDLVIHGRDPATNLPAGSLKSVHPLGLAPVIEDGALVLSESGAIVEYLIDSYGRGRLRPPPEHPAGADPGPVPLRHNGTPAWASERMTSRSRRRPDNPIHAMLRARLATSLEYMDVRLEDGALFGGRDVHRRRHHDGRHTRNGTQPISRSTSARTPACATGCIATPRAPRIAERSSGATPDLSRY